MSEFQLKEYHDFRSFFDGVRAGIELYAHWKDGVEYVGTCGRTLEEAVADIWQQQMREVRRSGTIEMTEEQQLMFRLAKIQAAKETRK